MRRGKGGTRPSVLAGHHLLSHEVVGRGALCVEDRRVMKTVIGKSIQAFIYDQAHILCGLAQWAVEFLKHGPSEPFCAYID